MSASAAARRLMQRPPISGVREVMRRYSDSAGDVYASALTYHAFLSLFPLLAVGLAVIGYAVAVDPALAGRWTAALQNALPGLGSVIGAQIQTVAEHRAAIGTLGLLGALLTGTQIVESAGDALNAVFRLSPAKGLVRRKAWALGSLAALGVLMLLSLAASTALQSLQFGDVVGVALFVPQVLLDVGLFLLAYRLLARWQGPAWRDLAKGALVAGVAWGLLKAAGGWYVRNTVANSALVYGTFAATIGILVVLSFASRFFVYGAVIAAGPDAGGRAAVHEMRRPEAVRRAHDRGKAAG